MVRILSINAHFVVQGPSGDDFKAAIFNLDGVETSSDTVRGYACCGLADTAGIRINSSKDAVHVINVVLSHASRADSCTETRICVLDASAMIVDFERGHVVIVAGSV